MKTLSSETFFSQDQVITKAKKLQDYGFGEIYCIFTPRNLL